METKPLLRLQQARKVLQAAEEKQGLRSYPSKSVEENHLNGGIYEAGTLLTGLVETLQQRILPNHWVGFIAMKNIGWEALNHQGISLEQIVAIDSERKELSHLLPLLVEGFDILVLGDLFIPLQQQKVLAARARMLEHLVFITNGKWAVSKPLSQGNWAKQNPLRRTEQNREKFA